MAIIKELKKNNVNNPRLKRQGLGDV